jgi:hypothetical protein
VLDRARPGGRRRAVGDADVVEPASEVGRTVGVAVGQQRGHGRLALGDRADPDRAGVPLAGGQRVGAALALGGEREAELVGGAEVAQHGAVGEREVQRHVRAREAQVLAE